MSKKKAFYVTVMKEGRELESHCLRRFKRSLSVGERTNCDIILPGIAGPHRLVEKSGAGYRLRLSKELGGELTVGGTSLSIESLIEFGLLKKKGSSYLFPLPQNKSCSLDARGMCICFVYRDIPESVKAPVSKGATVADRTYRKSFISAEDYPFLAILLITAVIQFSFAAYLSTVKIRKKEHAEIIAALPQRFAKLVLQQKKVEKKKVEKIVPLEEVKDSAAEQEPEQKTPDETKVVQQPVKQEAASESGQQGPGISTGDIREKVKSKGLLGVIMAKGSPVGFADDSLFKEAGKLVTGISKSGKGMGGGSGVSSEDILSGLIATTSSDVVGEASREASSRPLPTREAKARDAAEIMKERKEIVAPSKEKERDKKDAEDTNLILRQRDEAEVYRAIRSYVGGLKYLYNNALKKDPMLKGRLTVKMIIGIDGKIKEAVMTSSTLGAPELEDAILKRINMWKFPESRTNEDFVISYTFDFAPVG